MRGNGDGGKFFGNGIDAISAFDGWGLMLRKFWDDEEDI